MTAPDRCHRNPPGTLHLGTLPGLTAPTSKMSPPMWPSPLDLGKKVSSNITKTIQRDFTKLPNF